MKGNSKLRFIVAENHFIYRLGMVAFLKEYFGDCFVSEAHDVRELLHQAESDDFDLMFIDSQMDGVNGQGSIQAVVLIKPYAKIIGLSEYNDTPHALAVFGGGAKAFLNKNAEREVIIETIKHALKGSYYAEGQEMLEVFHSQSRKYDSGDVSNREGEVLRLICQELSNKQIAEKLCIAITTVQNHRKHLYNKLGVHNTSGLMMYAAKMGFL